MRLICIGDSWTYGYGIEDKNNTYPYLLSKLLNRDCVVIAKNGNDNLSILDSFKNLSLLDSDIVLIGWTGISRFMLTDNIYTQISLSYVPNEDIPQRKIFFESHDLDFIRNNWQEQLDHVHSFKNVFSFSVFGDKPYRYHKKMIMDSFLEYLAIQFGIDFDYTLDIFEFDFLHELNTVTEDFMNRYCGKDWKKACIEREAIRPGKYFFNCGHPNEKGHEIWAHHLYNQITNGHR